jgi:hypothetical protein
MLSSIINAISKTAVVVACSKDSVVASCSNVRVAVMGALEQAQMEAAAAKEAMAVKYMAEYPELWVDVVDAKTLDAALFASRKAEYVATKGVKPAKADKFDSTAAILARVAAHRAA